MELLEPNSHTFDTIVGQDLVKRFLLRACEQGRLPHALLFTGPDGVGKRSLIYALAKHLVTAHLDPDADAARRARGKVERGSHPDVLVVQPKSASGQILRGQVDEMHDRAHYAPLESPNKIIVITPIEAMNPVAANNILKLLEEPPPALHLILSTRQIHQTLPTIRSRCALVRCPPVDAHVLTHWIITTTRCPQQRASAAAALSGGRPGLAVQLVTGEDEERRRRVCGELEFFRREGYPAIFRVGRNLLDAAGGAHEALGVLLAWFRDLLVAELTGESGGPELLINRDLEAEVAEAAGRYGAAGLARAVEVVLEHQLYLSRPFIEADLLMEVFLTRLGMALKGSK